MPAPPPPFPRHPGRLLECALKPSSILSASMPRPSPSRSRIIRTLLTPMGYILAWASLYGFYETCLESGVLPSYLPKWVPAAVSPNGTATTRRCNRF